MAYKNPSGVSLTGGTINSVVIGGISPAAGSFTTLSSTGLASLNSLALSVALPISSGGTGATSASAARTALGLDPTTAQYNANQIQGKSISVPSVDLTVPQYNAGSGTITWITLSPGGVTSFNSRTGAVLPQSGDYTTTQVTEGTNLYFTTARAQAAFTAGSGITISGGVISALGGGGGGPANAVQIQGTNVTITSLASGNFLRSNGTEWVNTNLSASDIPIIPNTQVSGLGTLSTQNANAVSITGGSAQLFRPKVLLTASRTLTVADINTHLYYSGTTPITITIPSNLISGGSEIEIAQIGTGTVTIAVDGSGVSINGGSASIALAQNIATVLNFYAQNQVVSFGGGFFPLSIAQGGTGATGVIQARSNLGILGFDFVSATVPSNPTDGFRWIELNSNGWQIGDWTYRSATTDWIENEFYTASASATNLAAAATVRLMLPVKLSGKMLIDSVELIVGSASAHSASLFYSFTLQSIRTATTGTNVAGVTVLDTKTLVGADPRVFSAQNLTSTLIVGSGGSLGLVLAIGKTSTPANINYEYRVNIRRIR